MLDLFSGIGGFSLGAEATKGFETVAFCEIDPFCRQVLKKHWPNVPIFEDITKLGEGELNGLGNIDVICGGFPCQDISCAGKGAGIHAARSGLWWEMLRIIRLVRPRYVLVENVAALLNRGLDEVLGSLAESGYDAEWQMLCANQFGAMHKRERFFMVAYPKSQRLATNAVFKRVFNQNSHEREFWGYIDAVYNDRFKCSFPKIPDHFRGHDGISNELDRTLMSNDWNKGPTHPIQQRVKALGNAIVPQVASYVAECVLEYDAKYQ